MIVLIHGKKRSGKDTLAGILKELEPRLTVKSFAGPLKEITAKSFDISLETVDYLKNNEDIKIEFTDSKEKLCTGNSVRNFLQNLGTEAIKPIFGNDVWAKLLIEGYNTQTHLLVPDFRVIEEYNTLTDVLGNDEIITVNIIRPDAEISGDTHITEQGLANFKFDYSIVNEGSLDDLRAEATEFLAYLKGTIK